MTLGDAKIIAADLGCEVEDRPGYAYFTPPFRAIWDYDGMGGRTAVFSHGGQLHPESKKFLLHGMRKRREGGW